jgi:hypothetical protein
MYMLITAHSGRSWTRCVGWWGRRGEDGGAVADAAATNRTFRADGEALQVVRSDAGAAEGSKMEKGVWGGTGRSEWDTARTRCGGALSAACGLFLDLFTSVSSPLKATEAR